MTLAPVIGTTAVYGVDFTLFGVAGDTSSESPVRSPIRPPLY